jgi:alpha-galactosidase
MHGTRATYRTAGCRCTPCRAANAAYWRAWWTATQTGQRPLGARIPAAEAHRVLKLLRLEWPTLGALARALGKHHDLARLRQARTITVRTELRLRQLYRTRVHEHPDRRRTPRPDDIRMG